jgi:hypothetical protein
MNTKYLLLILFGLAFTEIHTIIPDSDPMDFFPLYNPPGVDYMITRKTYFYFMGQHLFILCNVAYIIFADQHFRHVFKNIFLLEFVDFIDYLLIYNTSYFHIGDVGINYAYVKIALYTYLIIAEIWRRRNYF